MLGNEQFIIIDIDTYIISDRLLLQWSVFLWYLYLKNIEV